jgi:hypothetical protein
MVKPSWVKYPAAAGQTDLKFGPLSAGNYTIAVRAYDKAGNYIEEKISIAAAEIVAPRITESPESIKDWVTIYDSGSVT